MASFGEELRRQRELRGVSLREISDATKISIRFLQALEENEFRHLPGGQFNKGFIRAYAGHIGVDPEGMVEAYLQELRRQDVAERPSARVSQPKPPSETTVRAVAIALALLLPIGAIGAGVLVYLRVRPPATSTSAPAHPRPRDGAHTPPASPAGGADLGSVGGAASGVSPVGTDAAGSGDGATEGADQRALPPSAPGPPQEDAAAGVAGAIVPPASAPDAEAAETSQPGPSTEAARNAVRPGEADRVAVNSGAQKSAPPLPRGAEDLVLRIIALQPISLNVVCDGRTAFDGPLPLGRIASFTCPGVYEVSINDAGGANVSVNGERVYLGRQGQSVVARHVSAANYLDYTNPGVGTGSR